MTWPKVTLRTGGRVLPSMQVIPCADPKPFMASALKVTKFYVKSAKRKEKKKSGKSNEGNVLWQQVNMSNNNIQIDAIKLYIYVYVFQAVGRAGRQVKIAV